MIGYDIGKLTSSKGKNALVLMLRILIALVLCVCSLSVHAGPLYLGAHGGISSPAPGISGGVFGCNMIAKNQCLGGFVLASHNEHQNDDFKQDVQHFSGYFEHQVPIIDEYRHLFFQANIGAAHAVRSKGDPSQSWGGSIGGAFGLELPVADLVGLRIELLGQSPLIKGAKSHIAVLFGLRFGAEWLGVDQVF
jgi:hypothetical protein